MIQVLLVDDQRLMRDGLRTLLGMEDGLSIAGTAANGVEALEFLAATPVDVVLMDIRMPEMDGITATQRIKDMYPQVKVLMLTTYEDRDDVVKALSVGAVGYLLKDMPAEEIATSIKTAHAGGGVLPPSVAKTFLTAVQLAPDGAASSPDPVASSSASQVMPQIAPTQGAGLPDAVTDREIEVLHCLAKGMSNKEISSTLFVTEGTVKNHVSSLIAKLELRDRTQVALFAVRNGFGGM